MSPVAQMGPICAMGMFGPYLDGMEAGNPDERTYARRPSDRPGPD